MSNYILYGITLLLLILSYLKDKKKTKMSLKKAWKAFENILPEFLVVIMLVGVLLAVLNTEVISKIIGSDSGWIGVMLSAVDLLHSRWRLCFSRAEQDICKLVLLYQHS